MEIFILCLWNILFCSLFAELVSPCKIQLCRLLLILCQSVKMEQGMTVLIIVSHAYSCAYACICKCKIQAVVRVSHCAH